MRTRITELLGIDQPLLAFSHSPSVVAAVSRAGGMGVLGAAQMTAEQLERAVARVDAECDGRPYGIDVIIPAKTSSGEAGNLTRETLVAEIPGGHLSFVDGVMKEYEVPPLDEPHQLGERIEGHSLPVVGNAAYNRRDALPLLDVVVESKASLFANALGAPTTDVVDRMHERGIKVAALAGRPRHAVKHRDAGVDVVIAQGYEAGGHTGDVASMVLIPDVVDAVGDDLPVLAAGGIASGRQMAAAMVLGACGAWTGSVWLMTRESEILDPVREKFAGATDADTIRSRASTGRPARHLRGSWTDLWDDEETPDPLPMPQQGMLTAEAQVRIERAAERDEGRAAELVTYFVGQVVGRLDRTRPVAEVFDEIVGECESILDGTPTLDRLAPSVS